MTEVLVPEVSVVKVPVVSEPLELATICSAPPLAFRFIVVPADARNALLQVMVVEPLVAWLVLASSVTTVAPAAALVNTFPAVATVWTSVAAMVDTLTPATLLMLPADAFEYPEDPEVIRTLTLPLTVTAFEEVSRAFPAVDRDMRSPTASSLITILEL